MGYQYCCVGVAGVSGLLYFVLLGIKLVQVRINIKKKLQETTNRDKVFVYLSIDLSISLDNITNSSVSLFTTDNICYYPQYIRICITS